MPTLDTRTTLSPPSVADLIHVQDVSDTTDGATGTSKKMTLGELQTFLLSPVNAKSIVLNGDTGNAPWRVQSSNGASGDYATDQVLYFLYNTEYDHAGGAWKARDVNGLPCIRHGLESNWNNYGNYQFEWNLDIAPPASGAPMFDSRVYGMYYEYSTKTATWMWRSTAAGTVNSVTDMMLDPTSLQVGTHFNVNISTGAIAIGNTVATAAPTANRTVQINIGGNVYYLLASTAAS